MSLLLYRFGLSQPDIERALVSYGSRYTPEKLHFHLDRQQYVAGDTVWFKAYMTGGEVKSTNLYVDWIDDQANLLSHQVYPLNYSGTAGGLFAIPENIAGRVLHLHAYTKWMLNFDSMLLYNKEIPVVGIEKSKNKLSSSTTANVNTTATPVSLSTKNNISPVLTFFPEGGNAVAGIDCHMAFLCCDQWGRPVKITGEIKDGDGHKIVSLQTVHNGMGHVRFRPSAATTYTAWWQDEQGNNRQTPLPAIQPRGLVLNISDVNNNKSYFIQRSQQAGDHLKQLHIVATQQQEVVYIANINLGKVNSTTSLIPTEGLAAGGLTITVFDSNWQPVAERICFVNRIGQATFTPQITWENISLEKRGYNQLLITLPDSLPANMSLSVTDAALPWDDMNNNNILSQLLLAGDIRGRVYNANAYLTDTTEQTKQNLDLVMLTHGWRRYNWDEIVKGEYPSFSYPKDTFYYTLRGKISGISAKKKEAADNILLILKARDSSVQSKIVALNNDGSFADPGILLFDSTAVFYRLNNIKGSGSYIKLGLKQPDIFEGAKGYTISRSTGIYAPGTPDTTGMAKQNYYLSQSSKIKAQQLPTVTVKAHKKTQLEKMDDLYVSKGLFKGNGAVRSYAFDVAHDWRGLGVGDIFDYLNGKLPLSLSRKEEVTYFIDEVPIPKGADLSNLLPHISEVAYIKAFPAPFAGAPLNRAAIVVYTKKGIDIEEETSGLPFILTRGYTPLKEFYQPDYGGKDSANVQQDIRPTLYWASFLLSGNTANKVRVAFYNNDVTDSFRLVLEGINSEGKLTRFEKVIKK